MELRDRALPSEGLHGAEMHFGLSAFEGRGGVSNPFVFVAIIILFLFLNKCRDKITSQNALLRSGNGNCWECRVCLMANRERERLYPSPETSLKMHTHKKKPPVSV